VCVLGGEDLGDEEVNKVKIKAEDFPEPYVGLQPQFLFCERLASLENKCLEAAGRAHACDPSYSGGRRQRSG
jgi:hypothetical protein